MILICSCSIIVHSAQHENGIWCNTNSSRTEKTITLYLLDLSYKDCWNLIWASTQLWKTTWMEWWSAVNFVPHHWHWNHFGTGTHRGQSGQDEWLEQSTHHLMYSTHIHKSEKMCPLKRAETQIYRDTDFDATEKMQLATLWRSHRLSITNIQYNDLYR